MRFASATVHLIKQLQGRVFWLKGLWPSQMVTNASQQLQLLIDGRWVNSESGKTLPVIDPRNEKTILEVAAANAKDVDKVRDWLNASKQRYCKRQ